MTGREENYGQIRRRTADAGINRELREWLGIHGRDDQRLPTTAGSEIAQRFGAGNYNNDHQIPPGPKEDRTEKMGASPSLLHFETLLLYGELVLLFWIAIFLD